MVLITRLAMYQPRFTCSRNEVHLMSTRIPSSSSSRLMLTIGLCFLVALMEGLDLQAAGIAAGGIAQCFRTR